MTRHWLQRHSFPEVTILYADDKPTVASQRGCNVAVEDSLRHARSYSVLPQAWLCSSGYSCSYSLLRQAGI